MAKPTVLDMTQEILSAMSSDEVNSIGDTTESLQVAKILERSFRDMVTRLNIPEHNQLFQLTPSNDASMPVLMFVPEEVQRIDWIKYYDADQDTGGNWKYVTILPTEQFLERSNYHNPAEPNVLSFTFADNSSGFPTSLPIQYINDTQPCYCTIISNKFIIFDAFNHILDDTLQQSKSMCHGLVTPVFRLEDTFVPELNDREFALLINQAKALAFFELKQTVHQKAEQEARRQLISTSKNKHVNKLSDFDNLPDFGRRTSGPRRFYVRRP